MMNPGSSKPLEEVDNNISWENINHLETSLVPTKPDTTQYQVMRVMHYCDWHHVRVLNISDLRNPKSGEFVRFYSKLENKIGFTAHSLFDDKRTAELELKLKRKRSAPIIYAWGINKRLDPLIERCLDKISKEPFWGLLKNNTDNKYFHPLPSLQKAKETWVKNLLVQLNIKPA